MATPNSLKYVLKKGQVTPARSVCDYVDTFVLAATVAEKVTVPTSCALVFIMGDADFWCNFAVTTTATVPTADITDGTSPVLMQAGMVHGRVVGGIAAFSIVAVGAPKISFEWYK